MTTSSTERAHDEAFLPLFLYFTLHIAHSLVADAVALDFTLPRAARSTARPAPRVATLRVMRALTAPTSAPSRARSTSYRASRVPAPCRASARRHGDENATTTGDDVRRSRRAWLASAAALALGASALATRETARAAEVDAEASRAVKAPRAREYYFGNGCFWGRQHTFYEAERRLGRSDDEITSVVGYAGGANERNAEKPVCYYYGAADTVYERLGHCEVVAVDARNASELRTLADAYFASFQRIPGLGMQRVDPQDAGPGYRNCIALPGGMDSPMFAAVEEANVHGMRLVRGEGNVMKSGAKPTETDVVNQVWIYDSTKLPFYPAEVYHQFHDGLGYKFPLEYTRGVKANALQRGLIEQTGCPEMRERSFADFVSTVA